MYYSLHLSGMAMCAALALAGLPGRAHGAFLENFETGAKGSYAAGDVVCTEGSWHLDNVLLGSHTNDMKNGAKSARGYGALTLNIDKANGVGGASLYHAMYGTDNNSGVFWTLSVSRDGGANWTAYTSPAQTPTAAWQQTSLTGIDVAGPVRVKIAVTGGSSTKRVNIDDIALSDHIAPWVTARPALPAPFTTRSGTPSAPQILAIAGGDLSGDAEVASPAGFEISRHSTSNYASTLTFTPTSGTIPATDIYIRMTGAAAGSFSGAVTVTSVGAAAANAAISGTVVANLSPEIGGLPALTNATVNHAVQFEMLATDPDGSVAQLRAASASIPDANAALSVQIEGSGRRGVWAWTPTHAGSNNVTFAATDNEGATVERSVAILVEREWLIAVRPGQTIRESFDTLEGGLTATALLPIGWRVAKGSTVRTVGAFESAVQATEQRGGNALSSGAANGIYNFGAGDAASATDRAVGFLSSGSATKSGSLMVRLTNRAREPIPGFRLAFDVEKYRAGVNGAGFAIQVHTSSDGANWSDAGTSLRLFFPADTVTEGYSTAPGAVSNAAGEMAVAKLPPGQSLYLAWTYSVAAGATTTFAQALAINNIVIKAHAPKQTMLILR